MPRLPLIQFELLLTDFKLWLLIALLSVAVWFDIRFRRIPNPLILIGLCASLLLQIVNSSTNISEWFFGLLIGFGLFIPLYLVRAMGAGDVKLMAMVGSFLGTHSTIGATLATLLSGGILAVVVALHKGSLKLAINNIRFVMIDTIFNVSQQRDVAIQAPQKSAGDLPYAVAISAGTLIQLILINNGGGIFV